MPTPADALFELVSDPRVRSEPAARVSRALDRLWRRSGRDARQFVRLHDRLLFLLAYPPSRQVRRKAAALLEDVPGQVRRLEASGADMDLFDELEIAGVAGTTITTDFSFELVRWLHASHPRRLAIDWGGDAAEDQMRASWPYFLPLLEEEALADANVPYAEWLRAAAGRRRTDVGWLLSRYERLPFSEDEIAERWDALGAPVAWDLGATRASRTLMRRPGTRLFLHRKPLLARRDVSLEAVLAAPRLDLRRLSRGEGQRVCDMVREATAARYREFYTFTFADPGSVIAARPGRGVEMFLIGIRPDRRLPLRAAYGGFMVKNGVPIGYIEGLAFFERLEIGFNLYYAFREGESAWIYAQALKMHRDALGVTSFSVDPYQLGFENEEAIDSGAFWFYRKLGFRATDRAVAALVAREEARIAADPAYRSSRATLRRLVAGNLLYEAPGSASGAWDRFHIRNLGLAVNREMARRYGGSAPRIRKASEDRVAGALRLRAASLAPLERRAFEGFAPVLGRIPDLSRWTAEERRGLVAIIRAKAGASERACLRRMQRHARLRKALIALGSRRS